MNVTSPLLNVSQALPTSSMMSSTPGFTRHVGSEQAQRCPVEPDVALLASLRLVVEALVHLDVAGDAVADDALKRIREARGVVPDPQRSRYRRRRR